MTYRRLLLVCLAVGLLAALFVTARRERHEHRANRVEIVMDDADFSALASSYAYNERAFLIALRRAGLTSLAVGEELGAAVPSSSSAVVYTGSQLIDQARLSGIREPVFAALAAAHQLRANDVYIVAYDAPTAERYARQLALKFSRHAVRRVHAGLPAVFDVRTQADYFAAVGLGLPADRVALAHSLGLRLVPRLQNDERFKAPQIAALLDDAVRGHNAHTVIFFGLRNEVLGYPDALDAAADAMRADRVNFGVVETYDVKQNQSGSDGLAEAMPDHVVRVQAIAKPEADKLLPEEIVQRYLLGVRERNIRVVYLRPFAHQWDGRSIEASNVELVRRIAQGIRASGLHVGTATPFEPFVVRWWEIAAVSLAVVAIVLLLSLDLFGLGDVRWLIGFVVVDVLLVVAGFAVHHDMAVRKLLALAGGIAFPVAGFAAIARAFRATPADTQRALRDGVTTLALALAVTFGGVLVVIGLLSTPLTMTEVDRFSGVKLVLAAPPLIALLLYLFTSRWAERVAPSRLAASPVTVVQFAVGAVLVGVGLVVLARSGNQSDLTPSNFELALRAHLTTLLQVRPRFKELLVGFPALMLVPTLVPADRARWGWLFALAIGVGLADVVDTFSHLHTPLTISLLRVVNGAVIGIVIGIVAIVVYRRVRRA